MKQENNELIEQTNIENESKIAYQKLISKIEELKEYENKNDIEKASLQSDLLALYSDYYKKNLKLMIEMNKDFEEIGFDEEDTFKSNDEQGIVSEIILKNPDKNSPYNYLISVVGKEKAEELVGMTKNLLEKEYKKNKDTQNSEFFIDDEMDFDDEEFSRQILREQEEKINTINEQKKKEANKLINTINYYINEARVYGTPKSSNKYRNDDIRMVLIKLKNKLDEFNSVISESLYDEININIMASLRRLEAFEDLHKKTSKFF